MEYLTQTAAAHLLDSMEQIHIAQMAKESLLQSFYMLTLHETLSLPFDTWMQNSWNIARTLFIENLNISKALALNIFRVPALRKALQHTIDCGNVKNINGIPAIAENIEKILSTLY